MVDKDKKFSNNTNPLVLGTLIIIFGIILMPQDIYIDDGVLRYENGSIRENYNVNILDQPITTRDIHNQEIIEGETYIISDTIDLSSGQNYQYFAKVNGRQVHLYSRKVQIIDLSNQVAEIDIDLFENVTSINNGTVIQEFNLNRNINNVENSSLMIYSGANLDFTNSLYIEPLSNYLISDRKESSFINEEIKYVLGENQTYGLNITNEGVGNTRVKITWIWHTVDY